MSVRINLEIGHEASLRNKKTHDGFTHDWEVFVRGCDNAEIHHYVEKVVFHLHETFPKPKRVIRDPPYIVKESGYAGFNFPIEIYLKNNGEPKKIKFNYDLHLQQAGPAIIKVQKEKYVFNSVSEEFKQKLVKGGGIIVSSHENVERTSNSDEKKELLNKPKLSGSTIKKHKAKPDEPYSFQYFGTPITKTSKVVTDGKPTQKDIKVPNNREKEKSKVKEIPKEKDKEREKAKHGEKDKKRDEKKKDKERGKERERSKEKSSKREKTPPARPRSPSPKKSPPKRQPSPQPPPPPPLMKHRDKEEKKSEKEQRKPEEKFDKKPKKDKREHKEKDGTKHKEKDLRLEHRDHAKNSSNKEMVAKSSVPSSPKFDKKEKPKETPEAGKEADMTIIEKEHFVVKEKTKGDDTKPKHKHKKKDKERRKEEKKEKRVAAAEKNNLFDSPKHDQKPAKPLNALIPSIVDDSSNNSLSSNDNTNPFNDVEMKREAPPADVKKSKTEIKKEKKRSKEKKDEEKKRKRKSEQVLDDEPPDKIVKGEMNNSEDEEGSVVEQPVKEEVDNKENKENPEDYMNILRDLQHKIMALQDNTELQKVVQLIAETGRYEVSARTFDFDLCLLERSTVKQLQEFFASSS